MKYLCEIHRADRLIDSFGANSTEEAIAAACADRDGPDRLTLYRTQAAEYYERHSGDTLPLDHARAAFPLYLALLPRGTPQDYDAWCESSGLKTAIAEILQRLPERHHG